ncbi:MAG: HNH endonuclease [Candidatus Hodarchaeota archaeon]
MAKRKNIKELLDQYKDHNEKIGYFPSKPMQEVYCEICKNFDSKKQFCISYDSYPFDDVIPPEEYCNEFIIDEVKYAKELEANKRKWEEIFWDGQYEEKSDQWIKGVDISISLYVKNEVWRRDQGYCVKCGSKEQLDYVPIIPFSKGGKSVVDNIQLLCKKCIRNKEKE